jgi:hypothetical protein
MPDRSLLCVKRNVAGVDQAWAFGKEFIALLRHHQLPRSRTRRRVLLYLLGEVSEDSDGPVEWCVPSHQMRRKAAAPLPG